VERLQKASADTDGEFGPSTEAAVRRCRHARANPDGVSVRTWSVLGVETRHPHAARVGGVSAESSTGGGEG